MSESRILLTSGIIENICTNLEFEEAIQLRNAYRPYLKEFQVNCPIQITDPDGVISSLPGVTDTTVQTYFAIKQLGSKIAFLKAAKEGNLDVFKLLLKLGMDPSISGPKEMNYRQALDLAVENNRFEILKELVKYGINPMTWGEYSRNSALHVAAAHGQINLIEYLLSIGADINDRDRFNGSALNYAVQHGQTETVRYLLDRGARIDDFIDNQHSSTLGNSLFVANSAVTKMILDMGANPNIIYPGNTNGLQVLVIWHQSSIPQKEQEGLRQINYLLDAGANINYVSPDGETALTMAADAQESKILKLLLQRGADPNLGRWDWKRTAFYYKTLSGF